MDTDPEYKTLSDLAEQLERLYPNGAPKGTVLLYSEMDLCDSCRFVAAQFEAKFPNIKVKVSYDHTYPFPKE